MKNNSLILQPLLLSGKYPAAVGGICRKGSEGMCIEQLKSMENIEMLPTADGVLIDAQLSLALQQFASDELTYAAMTAAFPWPDQPCGGIAGRLWDRAESAPGTLCQFEDGLWGFALPGACACIMSVQASDAEKLYGLACELPLPLQREDIETYLAYVQEVGGQFLFVSDGSGGSCGCLCVIANENRNSLWL